MRVAAGKIEAQLVTVLGGVGDVGGARGGHGPDDGRGPICAGWTRTASRCCRPMTRSIRAGRLNMRPQWKVVPRPALDGAHRRGPLARPSDLGPRDEPGGGQVPRHGVGVVAVFTLAPTSARPGCYAKIAAGPRGESAWSPRPPRGSRLVPTFAAEPVMGTNPLCLRGAPRGGTPPFQLDMGDDDGGRRQGEGLQAEPQAGAVGLGGGRRRARRWTRRDGGLHATCSSGRRGGITPARRRPRAGLGTRATASR